ncbi:uncharacterized protein N7458_000854 [Penicillium daleae]|uniref:Uncharacterized protein n=1 Tax=Penicillium daleae TaxID=63821 RepID=A0AAD6CGX9_9EURO|nr:uncharacterized protein N7458_000854 [Penicillium daleae]KAJ5465168.1 hypothetical protein N7458_000854 [Penicillium daleae]
MQNHQAILRLRYVRCILVYDINAEADSIGLNSKGAGLRSFFLIGNPTNFNGCLQSDSLLPQIELALDTQAILESSGFWLPLAQFIPQLPSLSDLHFLLPTQFPKLLLDQIHKIRPDCRLHIDRFFLLNLVTPSTDSYEFLLASSPCLFSLKTIHEGDDNPNIDIASSCYHEDALACMTSGLAPNLKKVSLVYPVPGTSPVYYTPPPWKGFGQRVRENPKKSLGNLRFLRFKHWWRITEDRMDYWNVHTDFKKLQSLEFDAYLTSDVLRHLATKFQLPCLETLVLSKLRKERDDSDDHAEAANKLLRSLPPLLSLTLDGWYPEISMDALATFHGSRLLELKLLNYPGEDLTQNDLEALGRHCLYLREFTLSLRRSQGHSTEGNLYKALGALPRLQSISLDLHIAKTFSPMDNDEDADGNLFNPSFDDEFDRGIPSELLGDGPDSSEACNGAMRERLINGAFDGILARSIFEIISSGKPQISLPLEELNVKITDAGNFGMVSCPTHFLSVLFHLCRPWRITRGIRDDCRHEIQVEVTEPVPSQLQPPPKALAGYLKAIWRRVWPEKVSEDWRFDWHSFPIS